MSKRLIFAALVCSFTAACGAPPEEVCAHIKEVVEKEAGPEGAKAATEGCERSWKWKNETKGIFSYKSAADCMMDAETVDALGNCK